MMVVADNAERLVGRHTRTVVRSPPVADEDEFEAREVTALFDYALLALDRFLESGTGTIEERATLHARLKDLGGNTGQINNARMALGASIAADLPDGGKIWADGRWWRQTRVPSRREPDRDWIRAQIGRAISGPIGLDEKGAAIFPTEEQKLAAMWEFVEPALGRTKVFGDAGIDLDDAYGVVEWRDDLTDS